VARRQDVVCDPVMLVGLSYRLRTKICAVGTAAIVGMALKESCWNFQICLHSGSGQSHVVAGRSSC
jgi:hypothetical protein